jgi:hypothetical protein
MTEIRMTIIFIIRAFKIAFYNFLPRGAGGDDLNIFQAFQLRASSIKSMTPFHRPGGVDIRTNDDRRNSHDL